MNKDEVERLASARVQRFILENEFTDEKKLVLQNKHILGTATDLLANQIKGRKKSKSKLPIYYTTKGIVYPPSINLEQCSSQYTAQFKARIVQQELHQPFLAAVDLTTGFGVDSYFLSSLFDRFESVDPDAGLLLLASHNHKQLGAVNVRYHAMTTHDFIQQHQGSCDLMFMDPSRRSGSKKVHRFSDCQPDAAALVAPLLQKARAVLIKASPLLDLRQGIRDLTAVQKVYVVAVDYEVKEVLFWCNHPGTENPTIEAVNLSPSDSVIDDTFTFTLEEEAMSISQFAEPQRYIYEPAAQILKAGAFKLVGCRFNVAKLSANTHLYTSQQLIRDFPGRIFSVKMKNPKPRDLTAVLPAMKANVIVRNYPLSVEALRKKLRIKDGGADYLLAFSGRTEMFVVLTERVK